eukprot:733322-Hanusia_phi.AAC.2
MSNGLLLHSARGRGGRGPERLEPTSLCAQTETDSTGTTDRERKLTVDMVTKFFQARKCDLQPPVYSNNNSKPKTTHITLPLIQVAMMWSQLSDLGAWIRKISTLKWGWIYHLLQASRGYSEVCGQIFEYIIAAESVLPDLLSP